MEMDELMTSLDVGVRDIGNKIPNINEGGCGLFAILLWDELHQLDMVTHPIVFTDQIPVWSIYHVMLRNDKYYIDCDGVHENISQYGSIETIMPLDVLQVEAYDEALWCPVFDRKHEKGLRREIHKLGANLLTQKRDTELASLIW